MSVPTTPTQSAQTPPRRLGIVWLLYFFQFLAFGAYAIYLNVYYHRAGLSGTQIGLITMTSAIIGVAGALGWGYASDRTGKPRLLIAAGAVGALTVAQFVPLVHTFWAFFALSCLGSSMSSSLMTLVDGATLAMLGSKSENYGRFRMGGSIGYILASSASGFLYDRTGLGVMFPIFGVMMGLFAATALFLPALPVKIGRRPGAQIGAMVRQPAWLIFAASIFLAWMANYAMMMYLGIALTSMGGADSLIGVTSTSGALAEIPFMAFSGWFMKRFGLARLLLVALIFMVVRYAVLGWMPTPTWAVWINLLNGPAYGLFATCAVAYANKLAPPALIVTSQGLLNSIMSLASVVSALLTGIVFDQAGPRGIFMGMAACCLAALVLFGLGALRSQPKATHQETARAEGWE